MTGTHRRIVLARRPRGRPSADTFRLEEAPDPEVPAAGLLVAPELLSMDPAIRGWLDDKPSYLPPVALGEPVRCAVLARVLASRAPGFRAGERIVALASWSERATVWARDVVRRLPADDPHPPGWALGVLGGAGLTAWFGLHEIGRPRAGETVLVSAAGGAVGSVVVQLARIAGCRVVGIVGTDEKADWVRELGAHDVVQRRTAGPMGDAIRAACPDGVDVYFDSVGGSILDSALRRLRPRGRVVLCGAISTAHAPEERGGPREYLQLLARSGRMEGFTTFDFADRWDEVRQLLVAHVEAGRIRTRETVVEGLERAPEALDMLFDGAHVGKLLVRVNPREAGGPSGETR